MATVTYTELVDANYHSTICRACNVVCHNHCRLTEITEEGSNAFLHCAAFSGDHCTGKDSDGRCKCDYRSHYHDKKKMITKTKSVEEILEDMKTRYEAAIGGAKGAEEAASRAMTARDQISASMKAVGEKILKQVNEIRSICSGFNVVDELHNQVRQYVNVRVHVSYLCSH